KTARIPPVDFRDHRPACRCPRVPSARGSPRASRPGCRCSPREDAMEVTPVRARLGSVLEWIVAAAFLAASILVATLIVRELRTAPRAAAVPEPPVSALPAGVPTRAISVPVLLLLDGREVRVG